MEYESLSRSPSPEMRRRAGAAEAIILGGLKGVGPSQALGRAFGPVDFTDPRYDMEIRRRAIDAEAIIRRANRSTPRTAPPTLHSPPVYPPNYPPNYPRYPLPLYPQYPTPFYPFPNPPVSQTDQIASPGDNHNASLSSHGPLSSGKSMNDMFSTRLPNPSSGEESLELKIREVLTKVLDDRFPPGAKTLTPPSHFEFTEQKPAFVPSPQTFTPPTPHSVIHPAPTSQPQITIVPVYLPSPSESAPLSAELSSEINQWRRFRSNRKEELLEKERLLDSQLRDARALLSRSVAPTSSQASQIFFQDSQAAELRALATELELSRKRALDVAAQALLLSPST